MEKRNAPKNFLARPQANGPQQPINKTERKPPSPISSQLRSYLKQYSRSIDLPATYQQLEAFDTSAPLYDDEGNDTLWETVIYNYIEMQEITKALREIYAILKAGGDNTVIEHLYVDRIDYCSFGNSKPFRIRIVNSRNDNQDYFYIKRADASRIYGLELEHLLSPNRMFYLIYNDTLVEEHIVGLPGDMFIRDWLENNRLKAVRIAKELIKFNERCFVRLLGDMRSYNFIVDITPDFEDTQIRIRAMDFDQQSYDARKKFYLPQFFKENNALVEFCMRHIDTKTAKQYQREEHSIIVRRMKAIDGRLRMLLAAMSQDQIAPREHVIQLRQELANHYENKQFLHCETMGGLVLQSLEHIKESALQQTTPPSGF
ncbi:hypothetical protein MLD52_14590 [Puniceicoccaceae bacterium K14]|nr:hypothetical protein [Puniceicoccaceae bacterium K14]